MSSLSKSKRKELPKRLRKALLEFQKDPNGKKAKELLPVLNAFNETMNDTSEKSQRLIGDLHTKLYQDDTVALMIGILPFFDQPTINAISTLLQTTVREFTESSLPRYLMQRSSVLQQLTEFFEQQEVSNVAHILFRACIKSHTFADFVYEHGIAGGFIQHLSGDDFARLATAFGTYEAILMTHPDISTRFVNEHWEIFQIQFKQLLSSPNYLVQLNFLPILTKFLTMPEARPLFRRFLEDVECLQFVMMLLPSTSKRVQNAAYSLFKLFVINPHRSAGVSSALRKNKAKLRKVIEKLPMDDDDEELEEEKDRVLAIIKEL